MQLQAEQEGFCWYIGVDMRYRPIENAQQTRDTILLNVRSRLEAVGIEAVLVDAKVRVRDEYLLVLPPFPSRSCSSALLQTPGSRPNSGPMSGATTRS